MTDLSIDVVDVIAVELSIVMAFFGVVRSRHGWGVALLKVVVYSSVLIALRHWVL